jgi:hypothetical protein
MLHRRMASPIRIRGHAIGTAHRCMHKARFGQPVHVFLRAVVKSIARRTYLKCKAHTVEWVDRAVHHAAKRARNAAMLVVLHHQCVVLAVVHQP